MADVTNNGDPVRIDNGIPVFTSETAIPNSSTPTPASGADSGSGSSTPQDTTGMIRNINQTVQEREIIKTAPDIIIYLDGKTYLLNPYITSSTQSYTFISFNDYVQNFTMACDTDNLVPSANFTLQVPNHSKFKFEAPGGNHLIETMTEVQIFLKGYYAAGNGNTVYHRVFKGVVAHIDYNDTGMFIEISIQCLGIMHMMEFMYIDVAPSQLSNSWRPVTPFGTNQNGMNPYQQLADTFLRGITFEGFELNAIVEQETIADSPWHQAVKAGYCNKWQLILMNLRKEVHILGYNMASAENQALFPIDINGFTTPNPEGQASWSPDLFAAKTKVAAPLSQIAAVSDPDWYVDVVRQYHPDTSIGSLKLLNGRITSRLERIRVILALIGYEGFQDMDGTIIFKPPLYNLDVTNVGTDASSSSTYSTSTTAGVSEDRNPFIVHLSEIIVESESEDEQAIKATRVTVSPSYDPGLQTISAEANIATQPAVTHIDIPKMAKFGLREEPTHVVPWITRNDKVQCYMYAVCELNRANRGWRTYNVTIPLRPELKLGFPMYLPHKDLYGYIRSIGISYSQGGACTMTVALDTLRKRPLFPSTNSGATASTQNNVLYTSQPNLVMQWTTPPNTSATNSSTSSGTSTTSGISVPGSTTSANPATMGGNSATSPSNSNSSILLGQPATQPTASGTPIYKEELEVVTMRRTQLGTSWSTKTDTKSKSFYVQNDKATGADASASGTAAVQAGQPYFLGSNWAGTGKPGVNMAYMQKILSCQPFTDEKGYEVVTPFPWGRGKTLKQALAETHLGVISPDAVKQDPQIIAGTDVFLFAGVGNISNASASTTLQTQLKTLAGGTNNPQVSATSFSSATTFEIQTPVGFAQPNILNNAQPDSFLISTTVDTVAGATSTFVTGSNNVQLDSASSLAEALKATIQNNPNVVGVTPKTSSTS